MKSMSTVKTYVHSEPRTRCSQQPEGGAARRPAPRRRPAVASGLLRHWEEQGPDRRGGADGPKGTKPSERSQTQKITYSMIPFI